MSSPRTPAVVLVVLDGWGYREAREGNAVALGQTPTWDALWARAPKTLLDASGLPVGLPEGQMGNSEVGHLNLGAGRIVMQDLVRIALSIKDGSFFANDALVAACRNVARTGGTLHLMGLIGSGGVHGLDRHLFALIDLAERERVPRVAIHALLDGRDTMPTSGLGYMQELLAYAGGRATVASMGGRYYGMDRDRRWPRTELWYRASVEGVGPSIDDPIQAIRDAYGRGETDEFIIPAFVRDSAGPVGPMRDGDSVICFNFRSDRMRQIVRALTEQPFEGFPVRQRPRVLVTTMTQYDPTFDLPAAFPPQSMARIMAEVVSQHGLRMFRTAETEKYPHVTYFFNGGIEIPYPGEERQLVASQKVATYDLMPEMSAPGVTDVLCGAISRAEHEFVLCNYANGDMVGHSGSLPATIRAVETVDQCLARVVDAAQKAGATLLVTADHGNCEYMIDEATGGPHTAHTTNPVPLVIVDPRGDRPLRSGGALCDVAPTILRMLGIEQPAEMTGTDLRVRDDVKALAGALVVGLLAASADAQVGYPPSASPFRDLLYKQDVTLFTGYYAAGNDPVGVAPQGAPMVGVRYEVRIGGPAQFFARAAHVFSERTVINPTLPPAEREIGTRRMPLYLMDLGIRFNLTGQKSYRGFVPLVTFGGGIASDFTSQRDIGDFRFGTPFALSLGGGVRYVGDGPFQARLDLVDYLYQIRYPGSYFLATGGGQPVRRGDQSAWTHNRAITVGASYQFFR